MAGTPAHHEALLELIRYGAMDASDPEKIPSRRPPTFLAVCKCHFGEINQARTPTNH